MKIAIHSGELCPFYYFYKFENEDESFCCKIVEIDEAIVLRLEELEKLSNELQDILEKLCNSS